MFLAFCPSGACFLGRGVGYHKRSEIWFNRNSRLQEAFADAVDCDAVFASLFNELLLYRQSTPLLPFLAFDPAEIDAVFRFHDFGSSVPFGLLQNDKITSRTCCSIGSQQGVDAADTVNAVDSCCANVECAERELVQPRPRPGGLVLHMWTPSREAGGIP